MRKRNLIGALVLLALGSGYAILTTDLPTRAFENTTEPSFFPWVVTACLFALSAALLIQGLLPSTAGDAPLAATSGAGTPKYLTGLAAAIIYLAALPTLGFVAANVPLFVALMLIYGERNWWRIAAGSVGVSAVLFYLFREVFQIRLPAGVLGNLLP